MTEITLINKHNKKSWTCIIALFFRVSWNYTPHASMRAETFCLYNIPEMEFSAFLRKLDRRKPRLNLPE